MKREGVSDFGMNEPTDIVEMTDLVEVCTGGSFGVMNASRSWKVRSTHRASRSP